MVRNYKKKSERSAISEEDLRKAINDVIHKLETPTTASIKYNLKRQTINSRMKKLKAAKDPISDSGNSSDESDPKFKFQSKYTPKQTFTKRQETEISEYMKKCSRQQFGLTFSTARKFAFDYARLNRIQCPANWHISGEAGIDWLQGFIKRNPSISLRKPEKTALARLTGFNKPAVDEFFQNLKIVYQKYSFQPQEIYNLDETGITTVLDSPKIISEKGRRTVSQAVSAERGSLVTLVAIINASGNHIPPIYIFPRQRASDRFLHGSISGSLALNSKRGWMIADLFIHVLKHIQKYTNCSTKHPILILLDNHSSHCSLETILYCRDNGIILLSFPPHTSHRLQLDVGLFGPFKKFCKTTFHDFMINNPSKGISIYEVASLTKQPYLRALSAENIIKSFAVTGIFPYNSLVFSDEDFIVENDEMDGKDKELPEITSSLPPNASSSPQPSTTVTDHRELPPNKYLTPELVRPISRILPKKRGQRSGKSRIYTDTPEKIRIEELKRAKPVRNVKEAPKKQKREKSKKERVKRVLQLSSSDSNDSEISYAESEKSIGMFVEDDGFSDVSPKLDAILTDDEELKEGDYILVKFKAKRNVFYVGSITEVYDASSFSVKFLRKNPNCWLFVEPNEEDVSCVLRSDIQMKLPVPEHPPGTSRSAQKYKFPIDLSYYYVK